MSLLGQNRKSSDFLATSALPSKGGEIVLCARFGIWLPMFEPTP
jgi:hypothetical protein